MPAEATRKDLLELLDMVRLLHGSEAGAELPSPVLSRMAVMIGCDSASYCRVDHRTQQLVATVVEPATTDLSESSDFAAVLGQHPAFVAHRQRRLRTASSVALTDLADLRSLRNLPIYTDFYRPRGTHDQLLNIVAVGRHQGTLLVFNRSRRGFSGRARELLELASPLVCQAIAQRERLSRLTIALRDAQRHAAAADRAAGQLAALTPREREVVDQLVEGSATVRSPACWASAPAPSTSTWSRSTASSACRAGPPLSRWCVGRGRGQGRGRRGSPARRPSGRADVRLTRVKGYGAVAQRTGPLASPPSSWRSPVPSGFIIRMVPFAPKNLAALPSWT